MPPIKTIFSCDLRSLALFRIGLGFALLVDLLSRVRDFRAHYTYFGVVPPPTGPEFFINAWAHAVMGTTWFMGLVFGLAALAALALMAGYKTRAMTVAGWLFLLFIQTRNGLSIQGGDNLFLLLFFWGIFLPLGARYSCDAAVDQTPYEESPNAFFSMGTVALLLQVACLYFFSALLKHSPEWVPDGTALYYAMHMDAFVLPTGQWLLGFPLVLQGLTYFTWVLELIGPPLLFSPWLFLPLRLSMVVGFVFLHLGIAAFMKVGIFPLINLVSLVPFTPSWCWDRLTSVVQKAAQPELTIFYDGDCEFCRKMCVLLKIFLVLPHTPILPAQAHPEIFELLERENTWVIQNSQGRQYTKWDAVLLLFQHSPILWPLGRILALSFFYPLGDRIYSIVATNRGRLSQLTRWALPYHRLELRPPPVIEWGVGFLAVYMVFINLTTLPNLPWTLSDPIAVVKNTLQLDQKWDMYAPHPRKFDGWFVMPGQLIDGTEVEVFQGRMHAPSLEDSNFDHYLYPTYRWRKYLQRLVLEENEDKRQYLGGYLCRVWNESHHPLQHLLLLQVHFFKWIRLLLASHQFPRNNC